MDFEQDFLHEAQRPGFSPQDAVKFCYQAAFGAEHLLADPAAAQAMLAQEWQCTVPCAGALMQPLGPYAARADVAAWKAQGLPQEWLFRLFAAAAVQGKPPCTREQFLQQAARVGVLAGAGRLPFDGPAWQDFWRNYRAAGIRPVHHSDAYRTANQPAYRVVSAAGARLTPLLVRLAALSVPAKGKTNVVALDGRAAAGKTTLGTLLADVLGAGSVYLDDFFLPPVLRTPERLAEPGGNVDTARFAAQVLPNLQTAAGFQYQRFDCSLMELADWRTVAPGPWRVVEGSYSCHPAFGAYMAVRAFADVSPAEQMRRIRLRNGETMAQRFAAEWIPMEERYFSAFAIREKADVVL